MRALLCENVLCSHANLHFLMFDASYASLAFLVQFTLDETRKRKCTAAVEYTVAANVLPGAIRYTLSHMSMESCLKLFELFETSTSVFRQRSGTDFTPSTCSTWFCVHFAFAPCKICRGLWNAGDCG